MLLPNQPGSVPHPTPKVIPVVANGRGFVATPKQLAIFGLK
jgi:hypothetical protein